MAFAAAAVLGWVWLALSDCRVQALKVTDTQAPTAAAPAGVASDVHMIMDPHWKGGLQSAKEFAKDYPVDEHSIPEVLEAALRKTKVKQAQTEVAEQQKKHEEATRQVEKASTKVQEVIQKQLTQTATSDRENREAAEAQKKVEASHRETEKEQVELEEQKKKFAECQRELEQKQTELEVAKQKQVTAKAEVEKEKKEAEQERKELDAASKEIDRAHAEEKWAMAEKEQSADRLAKAQNALDEARSGGSGSGSAPRVFAVPAIRSSSRARFQDPLALLRIAMSAALVFLLTA